MAAADVTRVLVHPMEVVWSVPTTLEAVPWDNTSLFIDPISYVIKSMASPTRCNNIAPPRWNIARWWYCAYPSIREYVPPRDLPVNALKINEDDLLYMGLGWSIAGGGVSEVPGFPRDQGGLPGGDSRAGLWRMHQGRVLGPWMGEQARTAPIVTMVCS